MSRYNRGGTGENNTEEYMKYVIAERNAKAKEEAEEQAKAAELGITLTPDCFIARLNKEGKYYCLKCNSVESGSQRIITHTYNCTNNRKKICQLQNQSKNKGGNRKRKSKKTNKRKHNKTKRHTRK